MPQNWNSTKPTSEWDRITHKREKGPWNNPTFWWHFHGQPFPRTALGQLQNWSLTPRVAYRLLCLLGLPPDNTWYLDPKAHALEASPLCRGLCPHSLWLLALIMYLLLASSKFRGLRLVWAYLFLQPYRPYPGTALIWRGRDCVLIALNVKNRDSFWLSEQ